MGLLNERAMWDSESEGDAAEVEKRFLFNNINLAEYSSSVATLWTYLFSTQWRIYIIRLLTFLTPSFLQGRYAREQLCPQKLSPTAYLDGMRGLAALFVFSCHYTYQGFVIAKGWGCDEENYDILKLPFLRIWFQGPQAVCVFFVISGYALSYRPLKLVRGRSLPEFSTTVSSLVFRRALRLYLPTAVSTFMILCLLRIGAYEWTRDFANDPTYMPNVIEPHPLRMDSAYEHFQDWALQMYRFVHVFGWERFGGSTSYDVHLWTIPVEFRCSLYLFLVLVGTARLRTRFRLLVVGFVMWFTYRHSRWDLLLFVCGMLLAEWDLIRGAHTAPPALPQDEKEVEKPSRSPWARLFWSLASILGLYLLCQPDDGGENTPGWRRLTSMIPEWWEEEEYRYWQSVGAFVFVAAVGHSRGWQRFFNLAPVQYLGKISYALYLMHGPAMHTVGYHFENWAYSLTGVEGHWYTVGFVLGACFCVPTVIWWADVFWRAVDVPSVKFAKWVEKRCAAKN
ncbi:acyltransferase family protein [Hirsutella rhossiliensis]|uniref:Acyltransferase family domain-containing protein n=1 Tax=Hirsutella rhossiliensis TaxID=111463 RepID=A0A9P8MZH7_9HYPO|nr:acyltransferase family domain-containing protein [Hirsutella rhossiliensis]KAH0963847.1 acyltransferase family domain-containing protein [Hirsutella rhossiliensis]